MSAADALRRGLNDLERAVRAAGTTDGESVNVSSRTNVVVGGFSGEANAAHRASASQTVRIRQRGSETTEEVEELSSEATDHA